MTTDNAIPPRLQEIIEEFSLVEGQDKLELLLEYSDNMPPLPERLQQLRAGMTQVHECMTPVFIHAEVENGGLAFYFDIPPESPTIRGYAAVLSAGLYGATPEQVMGIPVHFYEQMGIHKVVGPQRLNGITAMLAYMKRLAFRLTQ